MLTASGLACVRGDRILFSGLGFTLLPGSLMLVKGGNGLGKTSLLRQLAGLLGSAKGKVEWEEEGISGNAAYLRELHYIGHANAIKPEFTVYENIAFWAELRGTDILIPAALRYFGLEDKADIPCGLLSAGWKRRVALARLLAIPARCWLLDEPSVHLDEEGKQLLAMLIAQRSNQGGIVVIATHEDLPVKPFQLLQIEDFRPQDEKR